MDEYIQGAPMYAQPVLYGQSMYNQGMMNQQPMMYSPNQYQGNVGTEGLQQQMNPFNN